MLWAIGITAATFFLEAAGGLFSGSLALLSDAGHVLTDLTALGVSLGAMILSGKKKSSPNRFELSRIEVLAALANSFTILLVVGGIGWGAFQRFSNPQVPEWHLMGGIALIGLAANALAAWCLHGAHEKDLNLKSAWLHVMGDLASSLGVLVGVGVIAFTGWTWVDPVLSLAIALLVGIGGVRLFWKATRILLE